LLQHSSTGGPRPFAREGVAEAFMKDYDNTITRLRDKVAPPT
jgi:hypothetical protein